MWFEFVEEKKRFLFGLSSYLRILLKEFLKIKACKDDVQIIYQLVRSSIWEFPGDGARKEAAATGNDSCWSYF